MRNMIRKALTKSVRIKKRDIEITPSDRLVYGVSFAIYALFGLVGLQTVHLIVLRSWNNEVFTVISGLIGTITGILIGQRA